jgi:hypothetical protein
MINNETGKRGGDNKKMRTFIAALAAAVPFALLFLLSMGTPSQAADSRTPKGGQGSYGEKQEIATAGDARKVLKRHFAGKDVIIGEVVEQELYFEAEVMDKKKTVIDKVIVDKRTGRVRSIY